MLATSRHVSGIQRNRLLPLFGYEIRRGGNRSENAATSRHCLPGVFLLVFLTSLDHDV